MHDPIFEHYLKELNDAISLLDDYVERWAFGDWDVDYLTSTQVYSRLRTGKKISKQIRLINDICESMDDHRQTMDHSSMG